MALDMINKVIADVKIKLLNKNLSKLSNRKIVEIIRSIKDDDKKIFLIKSVENVLPVDFLTSLINSIKADDKKIVCMESEAIFQKLRFNNLDHDIISIIRSLKDNNIKINLLSSEKYINRLGIDVIVNYVIHTLDGDIKNKVLFCENILNRLDSKTFANIIPFINVDEKKIIITRKDIIDKLDNNFIEDIVRSFGNDDTKLELISNSDILRKLYSFNVVKILSSISNEDKKISLLDNKFILDKFDNKSIDDVICSFSNDDRKVELIRRSDILSKLDSFNVAKILSSINNENKKISMLDNKSILDKLDRRYIIDLVKSISDLNKKVFIFKNKDVLDKLDKSYFLLLFQELENDKKIYILKHCNNVVPFDWILDVLNTIDSKELKNEAFFEVYKFKFIEKYGEQTCFKIEELMNNLFKNNSKILSTINLDMLNPTILDSFDFPTFQRIVMFPEVQTSILKVSAEPNKFKIFTSIFSNYSNYTYAGPFVEKLSNSLNSCSPNFINCVSNRLENNTLTEEEKSTILYLVLNPDKTNSIKSFEDVENFNKNEINVSLERINDSRTSSDELKDIYCQSLLGISYNEVKRLISVYGDNVDELLEKYGSNKQYISEIKHLHFLKKLINLENEQNMEFLKYNSNDLLKLMLTETDLINKRNQNILNFETNLKKIYGMELVDSIDNKVGDITEKRETSKEGKYVNQQYVTKKVSGEFVRMVSLLGAYRTVDLNGDMYDRWHTNEHSDNHALCFSLINQSNPGTAACGGRSGIIISFKEFNAEGLLAAAPEDIFSRNDRNIISSDRPYKFLTTENMCNNTRVGYSEYNIEVTDEIGEKIPIDSIICFEEADQDSIDAAIELSKRYGRDIPIEIIDRKELAKTEMAHILESIKNFVDSPNIEINEFMNVYTKFGNVVNANSRTNMEKVICENGPFNDENLSNMIKLMTKYAVKKVNVNNIEMVNKLIRYLESLFHYLPEVCELRNAINNCVLNEFDNTKSKLNTNGEILELDKVTLKLYNDVCNNSKFKDEEAVMQK